VPSKLLEERDSSLFSPLIDLALSALGAIFLLFLIFLWYAKPVPIPEHLRFLDVSPDAVIAGQNYVFTFPVTGGCSGDRHFSLQGTLPEGLRFDTDSGTLHGVVEFSRGQSEFPLELRVVDAWCEDQRSAVLHLFPTAVPYDRNKPPFRLLRESVHLPPARVGRPYEAVFGAQGGVEPYRWSVDHTPLGLALEDGRLRGTPRRPGSFDLRVTVFHTRGHFIYRGQETRWWGGVDERDYTLTVLPELRHRLSLPSYVRVGEPSVVTVATNGLRATEVVKWREQTPGMDSLEGGHTLEGVPTQPGAFEIAYQITEARDILAEGSGVLHVLPRVDFRVGGAVLQGWSGEDLRYQIPHRGGVEPISITANTPLPAGLRVEDQLLVGRPLEVGLFPVDLVAEDALGRKAEGQVTLRVGVRF